MPARHFLPNWLRHIDVLGATPPALLVVGNLAAYTLLGVAIHDDLAKPQAATAMAVPDTPVDQFGVMPEEPAA